MTQRFGRFGALGARFCPDRRSKASRNVMDDAKPPENAFRDALIAFADKYAV
jgi:hypothetical protein